MRTSFKYRIYLSKGQQRILAQQLEESRWVYNKLLAERKRAYEERGESLRTYDMLNLLPVWKLTRPSMKLVHSQVLQNIGIRVDLAFHAFFRRVKEGAAAVGFPRFKGFGRYDSLTYPQYGNGVRLEGERLILSKRVVSANKSWVKPHRLATEVAPERRCAPGVGLRRRWNRPRRRAVGRRPPRCDVSRERGLFCCGATRRGLMV